MLQERIVRGISGWGMVVLLIAGIVLSIAAIVAADRVTGALVGLVVPVLALDLIGWAGLTVVNPNTARVLLLFGSYRGTIKEPGFWWVNPLTVRRPVSLRVRNFESSKLKVNDHIGNPIEIAAIVVWRVIETAEAMFQVDDYE